MRSVPMKECENGCAGKICSSVIMVVAPLGKRVAGKTGLEVRVLSAAPRTHMQGREVVP